MDNKQMQLGLAIGLATAAHHRVFDKGGKPYILHPLHLMSQLMFDPELATIAILHDVVEDSSWTIDDLVAKGYSDRVTDALELLTHDPADNYGEYIAKVCTNLDAVLVKRKDIEHNSDVTRLKGVTQKDLDRVLKYHYAFIRLGEAKRELQEKL